MIFRSSLFLLLFFSFCANGDYSTKEKENEQPSKETITDFIPKNHYKMNGVSFESPPRSFPAENFSALDDLKANWIGFIPFGFSYPSGEKVHFNSDRQWWGERPEGIKTLCDYANTYELKTMIKPQVWIPGSWVGEFDLKNEKDIQEWEQTYSAYILEFAQIAQEKKAALFCIGTEYKLLAVKRPEYWRTLIKEVRAIYDGPLTYASNWDHYENIPFWDELDFIGINAYFPLVEKPTPSISELKKAWKGPKAQLKAFSDKIGKPILFTEYGYMSCDYAAWKTWENEEKNPSINLEAQAKAYQALYETFWNEDWWAGGFLWEWQSDLQAGGVKDKHYSPQRKPAEKVIHSFFSKTKN